VTAGAGASSIAPPAFEITILKKAEQGPLTKRTWIEDGEVLSDGSPCSMSRGNARRFRFDNLDELALSISGMRPHEAWALGALRSDLPEIER
jgi:hypothetical protein